MPKLLIIFIRYLVKLELRSKGAAIAIVEDNTNFVSNFSNNQATY